MTINGTITGRFGLDDRFLFAFWHLDQIRTFADEGFGVAGDPDASRIFVIADYSIAAFVLGVHLSSDPELPTPILTDAVSPFHRVAESFTEFVELYLRAVDTGADFPFDI